MDYKDTLNLPKTTFPMKANLPKLEPEMLERWEAMDIYGRIRQAAARRPLWILHDGPPYANGHMHLGHALNKILKDVVVVALHARQLRRLRAGMGLPRPADRAAVDKEPGSTKPGRRAARQTRADRRRRYAPGSSTSSSEEFKRWGVRRLGPSLLTLDPRLRGLISGSSDAEGQG